MIAPLERSLKRLPIGIDIGETGVRAVQLLRAENRYETVRVAQSDWPAVECAREKPAQNVAEHIRRCMAQAEFRGRSVVTAVNTPDLEFHTLELPQAKASEIEQVVRWEVERLTTARGEQEIRHWRLPFTKAAAPSAIGVATPRAVALDLHATCRSAGLVCEGVDAAATALCRFGRALNDWSADIVWGMLDLGYRETRLVLCVDDVPVLVRQAGRGGHYWTERIAESLQTSTKTAEVQKRDHGLAPPAREGSSAEECAARSSNLGSILLGILRSDLNDLASEVKRSYEYVLSCYPQRHVGGLVLTGGGAAMRNLPEFLGETLGIPVKRASAFLPEPRCRVQYATGKQNPLELFALAAGLAMDG